MDNPGEVSQILSDITFHRNNIFLCGKKLLKVLKITCMWLLSASKNIVPIKSYATFKSSKFATLPQDYPSLIEYEIFGEGSHISTNQRRESTVFSLLIG